jgi:hypothetical protein
MRTALLPKRHSLGFGQLNQLHSEDVHELTVGLRKDLFEQPGL